MHGQISETVHGPEVILTKTCVNVLDLRVVLLDLIFKLLSHLFMTLQNRSFLVEIELDLLNIADATLQTQELSQSFLAMVMKP